MSEPLVTFLSPCYNHGKYVIESLESVRNQTYKNIHHIIIDDCSTDDSVEKIQAWIDKHSYKCVFIKHKTNQGISKTQNESIRLAKGEFWTSLATDDIAYPERTRKFVDYLTANPESLMVSSDCELMNNQGEKDFSSGTNSFLELYGVHQRNIEYGSYRSLLEGNYIPASMMVRMAAFKQLQGFNERLKLEDWEMWLRISSISPIGLIDEQLTRYRVHPQNSIKTINFETDELKTFVIQRKTCYKNNYKDDYLEIYKEKFKHNFEYNINNPATRIFLKESPTLVLKVLLSKLINKFNK